MLSRRNVRIKVLQTVYAWTRDPENVPISALEENYRKATENSYRLYLYNILLLQKIASYARHYAVMQSQRYVPDPNDPDAAPFAENPIVVMLERSAGFNALVRDRKLSAMADADMIRKLFMQFAKTEDYRAYITNPEPSDDEHRNILLKLYKMMMGSELLVDHLEEHFPSLYDDESLMGASVKRSIKAMPEDLFFYKAHELDPTVVREFGGELLYQVARNSEEWNELIKQFLTNWDLDRLATLDMLMIKMGLAEFMYCPTIPVKVTINEYVEISKEYSTNKSWEFINGMLDKILHYLEDEGKVKKIGRGTIE